MNQAQKFDLFRNKIFLENQVWKNLHPFGWKLQLWWTLSAALINKISTTKNLGLLKVLMALRGSYDNFFR